MDMGFLGGLPAKITTLLDRLSPTWAAKLDALRTGMTDARMGYLDKLNITGNVASAAGLAGLATPSSQMTGIIKSIQHIDAPVQTGTGTSFSVEVTITAAVNTDKTLVLFNGIRNSPEYYYCQALRLTATNKLTLTASRSGSGDVQIRVAAIVVEFY